MTTVLNLAGLLLVLTLFAGLFAAAVKTLLDPLRSIPGPDYSREDDDA